jgi:hypothetical protein
MAVFLRLVTWLKATLSRIFLPDGYPNSVTNDYLGYVIAGSLSVMSNRTMDPVLY